MGWGPFARLVFRDLWEKRRSSLPRRLFLGERDSRGSAVPLPGSSLPHVEGEQIPADKTCEKAVRNGSSAGRRLGVQRENGPGRMPKMRHVEGKNLLILTVHIPDTRPQP
jgi:hypothetical protein